jgi:hypothetical protein
MVAQSARMRIAVIWFMMAYFLVCWIYVQAMTDRPMITTAPENEISAITIHLIRRLKIRTSDFISLSERPFTVAHPKTLALVVEAVAYDLLHQARHLLSGNFSLETFPNCVRTNLLDPMHDEEDSGGLFQSLANRLVADGAFL